MNSYCDTLIKFTLTHYVDIMNGKITPEDMGDFCRSGARRNPLETALIWKADIDRAIKSLAPKVPGWDPDEITTGQMLRRVAFSPGLLSSMQQDLIVICMLGESTRFKTCNVECRATEGIWVDGVYMPGARSCANEGIITRMRKFLNQSHTIMKYRKPVGVSSS
jgi:hypothetical protein